jgi:hypothetical protein
LSLFCDFLISVLAWHPCFKYTISCWNQPEFNCNAFFCLLALIFKFKSLYSITSIHEWFIIFFKLLFGLPRHTRESGTVRNSLVPHSASTQTTFSFTLSSEIKKSKLFHQQTLFLILILYLLLFPPFLQELERVFVHGVFCTIPKVIYKTLARVKRETFPVAAPPNMICHLMFPMPSLPGSFWQKTPTLSLDGWYLQLRQSA